ncbi:GNAT family N-acetyltransferase [Amphritea sp. HPY]|uniref:GNAT family N-acetyltransferase n=1 Tax=Amphritea sp. HPY TaxID=3421652 RepID=UPI003D7E6AB3
MNYSIPEQLLTERMRLVKVDIAHWPELHQYYSDEQATKYTTGKPLTEGESWRIVACLIGHWQIHGYGPYTMLDRDTGEVIGVVGLWYPGDWPEPEMKWALLPACTGQGYAREAAVAVKGMVRDQLPHLSLISLIFEQNIPSRKLAESVGARFERMMEFRGKQAMVYRHSD